MKVRLVGAAALAMLVAGFALGQVYTADEFSCTGDSEGGLCWLSDPRLYEKASWHFSGIPQGVKLILRLEGTAEDYCHDCVGRDVLVRIYYGTGYGDWSRMELMLTNRGPGCTPAWYTVAGEAEFTWWPPIPSSELVFIVQRLVDCDPHVGFNLRSLTLEVPGVALPPVPPPPPPPTPTPPTPPPTPPLQETCLAGMEFSCAPVDIAYECAPLGMDLATVARETLPDTAGPGEEAIRLPPGHYLGSLGEGDYHDWYRVRVEFSQGAVVYVRTFGDLVLDVFIIHDPCGTTLAECLEVEGEAALVIPCYEELRCERIPTQGESVCFLSGACNVFVRLVRRSGEGEYFLSILPAALSLPE